MKRSLLLLCALLCALDLLAWGQKGHDVTAYIAECHLTPEAAARIDRVLGGHSPVYYANWLDNASHTPPYVHTLTWHYMNVDEGETFETMPRNPKGDVLSAVRDLVAKLERGCLDAAAEAEALKMLIHLVGDMHCPMHTGHLSDLGGNRIPVLFFRSRTYLHAVWDTALVEAARKWSYTEWRQQIDRAAHDEVAAMQAGEPGDWIAETQAICTQIYADTPEGTKISYDYVAAATPVIELQFLRGGLRLAKLLNRIYGK
ncbi:S1/P1 nuclease [uncultured Parabacteroides sp.]|uniref:S1/P1 nuclease n=1 Tax=uncultured Parabacteroides sp. TaxID=512312 RepID=UPI0026E96D43|nr:S1/P1 nuclease [uncultured Parabacteroides sp.]